MKKLYTLLFVALTGVAFGQSIVITKIVDGTLGSGGCTSTTTGTSSPKIVEMYVSGTLDLTNHRFQTESNGAATAADISWSSSFDLTPFGTRTNTFLYLVVGSGTPATAPLFSEMYPTLNGSNVIISTNAPNGNGNDAYRIALYDAQTGGNLVSVIDQFGNPLDLPTNDYSAAWCYQDSYASRNNGVAANGGTFVTSSFTYGGNGAFVTPNNTCAFISSAINLGNFTLSSSSFDAIEGLTMYPNPLKGDTLFLTSTANAAMSVQIFDVLGKEVLKSNVMNNTVNVSGLNAGVYIVKVTEEGKTATRKLVIQ